MVSIMLGNDVDEVEEIAFDSSSRLVGGLEVSACRYCWLERR